MQLDYDGVTISYVLICDISFIFWYTQNTMIEIAIAFGQNEIFELLLNDERVNLDFQPNNVTLLYNMNSLLEIKIVSQGVPLAILSCISDYKTFSYFYSRGFDVSSRIPPDNEVYQIIFILVKY